MFLIGISGSILPYLVLLGVVVILSVQADSQLRDNAENTAFNISEKQLVYELPDVAGRDDIDKTLFVDFFSSDECKGECSGKQQMFSFVEFLSALTDPGGEKPPFYFFSRIFASLYAGFNFSGLSPPLFRIMD